MHRIIFYTMGSILRDARQVLDKELAHLDFSRYEWLTIIQLSQNEDPVAQADIKDYLNIDDSYLSKVLDKLEAKNIITRIINKTDRRSRLIKLCPEADTVSSEILEIALRLHEKILSHLTSEERDQLVTLLNKLQKSIHTKS